MTAAHEDEKTSRQGTVIMMAKPTTANDEHRGNWRPNRLLLSFLLCVCLPFLAGAIYYSSLATERFASFAGFSIRGIDKHSGIDGLGALTGLASTGSTTSDSYIVLRYLESRELVEALDAELDLRSVYSSSEIDLLSRLSPDATVEEFLDYWKRRTHTSFDPASGIIEIEVQSFSPEHAQRIADSILALAQKLVNELSSSARNDALQFARQEVELEEKRLRAALAAIRDFRASEQSVDPSASAALEIQLLSSLEARLIDVNARISALRQTLNENAPSLVALRRDADALSAQIVERKQAIGSDILVGSGTRSVPQQLALYEELEVDRGLAQQAYASALVSLEQARRDADREQRYLAIHLRPQPAQSAEYPRTLHNLFVLAFALVAVWGLGALITYSVRDHLT